MLVNDDEITALRAGEFELHCLEMRLERKSADERCVISGPGRIAQLPDGQLGLTVYAPEQFELGFSYLAWPAGQVIPEDAYFALTATDIYGRQWTSHHILPHVTRSGPQRGSLVIAR